MKVSNYDVICWVFRLFLLRRKTRGGGKGSSNFMCSNRLCPSGHGHRFVRPELQHENRCDFEMSIKSISLVLIWTEPPETTLVLQKIRAEG